MLLNYNKIVQLIIRKRIENIDIKLSVLEATLNFLEKRFSLILDDGEILKYYQKKAKLEKKRILLIKKQEKTDLVKLQEEIGSWAKKTFPTATPESWVKHLKREVKELEESQGPEEASDMFILLLGWCHIKGCQAYEIIDKKMQINYKRKWGRPDAEGVVEHIKN